MRLFRWLFPLVVVSAVCLGADVEPDDDYVDPFDMMNFDPVNVRMRREAASADSQPKDTTLSSSDTPAPLPPGDTPTPLPHKDTSTTVSPSDTSSSDGKSNSTNCSATCQTLLSLFQQYLMQLVHVLEPVVGDPNHLEDISLRLLVSGADLATFRRYAEGSTSDIHTIHETLSHMIQRAHRTQRLGQVNYWLEEQLGLSAETLAHVSAISVCAVVIVLTVSRLSRVYMVTLVFVVSAVFTWLEMYQKEKATAEKQFVDGDNHCAGVADVPWYGRMWRFLGSSFTFQEEECREYYQAMVVNPVFKVSPLEACAVAFVKTVVTPLEVIGHGIKRFLIGLLKDLPVQIQTSLLLFLGVLFVLSLFLASGYRLRIPWLLSIEPSHRPAISGLRSPDSVQQAMDGLSGEFERLSLTDSQLRHSGVSDVETDRVETNNSTKVCKEKLVKPKCEDNDQSIGISKDGAKDSKTDSSKTDGSKTDTSENGGKEIDRTRLAKSPKGVAKKENDSCEVSQSDIGPTPKECQGVESCDREMEETTRGEVTTTTVEHPPSTQKPDHPDKGAYSECDLSDDLKGLKDILAGGDTPQLVDLQQSKDPDGLCSIKQAQK